MSLIAAAGNEDKYEEQFEKLNKKITKNTNMIQKFNPLVPLEKFIDGLISHKCLSDRNEMQCIDETDLGKIKQLAQLKRIPVEREIIQDPNS